ncbi:MAG: right-handed parallel beta-helix repeat-containing protein, partial [Rudaea sp.]
GPNDTVTLRNIQINGIGSGLDGVRFLAGKQLIVDHCEIFGFSQNGIDVVLNQSTPASVTVRNTRLSDNAGDGIKVANSVAATPVFTSLSHVAIRNGTNSVEASVAAIVDINNSEFRSFSGSGLLISGSGFNSGTISAESSIITGGGTAVNPQAAGAIRLSNNDIFSNTVAVGSGVGTVVSAGNNRQAGNGTGFQLRAATITTF